MACSGAVAKQLGIEPRTGAHDLALCRRRLRLARARRRARTAWIAARRQAARPPGQARRRRARKASPSPPIAPRRATACGSARTTRRQAHRARSTKAGKSPRGRRNTASPASMRPRACTPARTSRREVTCRPRRPQHAGLHARAARHAVHVRARKRAWTNSPTRSNMDPVELRRVNDTQTDPVDGKPFSSRSLMKCFDAGGRAVRLGAAATRSPARCATAIG